MVTQGPLVVWWAGTGVDNEYMDRRRSHRRNACWIGVGYVYHLERRLERVNVARATGLSRGRLL